MQVITLSKQAIYTLHTLSKSVSRVTGFRCKLSRPKQLMCLLKLASMTKNERIRAQFIHFLSCLDKEQIKKLIRYGVRLPRNIMQSFKQPLWQTCVNYLTRPLRATANVFTNMPSPAN